MTVHDMQNLNRATMGYISSIITPGMTLIEVRDLCERFMLSHGADSFWYWDVGAFVFAGDETTLSVSGKEYTTSRRGIAENDIVFLATFCISVYCMTILRKNQVCQSEFIITF